MPYPEKKKDNRSDIWILIPAFNVELYLKKLLDQVFNYVNRQKIIVVDDGSHDETGNMAFRYGINLLTHQHNRGKGAALRNGFAYLLKQDAQWVITLDGDLQHDPHKIPEFVQRAKSDRFDLIIGRRKRNTGGMPWDRRFSNWFTSRLISLVTGRRIADSQSGYRMIRCDFLRNLELNTNGYEFETELLLKLCRAGARIDTIDIPTIYRGEASSIKRFTDTLKFLGVVIKFILKRS